MLPSAQPDGVGTLSVGFSRLNNPACMPPVNASPTTLRAPAHDSGPMRFAIPSSCGTDPHYLSPVLIGATRQSHLTLTTPRGRGFSRLTKTVP